MVPILNDLALTRMYQGDNTEALALMRQAYGPEHNDVVYATGSLGRNQYYLGRKPEAERHLRWALQVTDTDGRLAPPFYARFGRILDSLQDTLARVTREQLAKIRSAR
jgi:Flp pilus assembly protein TadD